MSKIKFLKSPIGLGIAHRVGETSVSLPDETKKMLVEKEYAVFIPEEKPKRTPPKVQAPKVSPKENTSVKEPTAKKAEKK
jgi:topoisomerase IA-like protein